jgi:polysaccharide biosynthesis/export protein
MQYTRIATAIVSLMACLLLGACATNSLVTNNPNLRVSPNGLPAPDLLQPLQVADDYRIAPQDLLTITVFGVTDLTQDVRVDGFGKITLPLIGSVDALGHTTLELQNAIATKLRARYMQNPQVTAFVKSYDSQHVAVEGVVKKPGVIPLTGPTTLLQVIADAQGLDDLADHKGVVVFREIKGQRNAAVFDIDAIGRGAVDDPAIYSNDVIVVAKSGSKDALRYVIAASSPFYYLFHTISP